MRKKIYVVRGSNDGNLGVYTTLKRALKVACSYVEMEFTEELYQKKRKENKYFWQITDRTGMEEEWRHEDFADVSWFYLNE